MKIVILMLGLVALIILVQMDFSIFLFRYFTFRLIVFWCLQELAIWDQDTVKSGGMLLGFMNTTLCIAFSQVPISVSLARAKKNQTVSFSEEWSVLKKIIYCKSSPEFASERHWRLRLVVVIQMRLNLIYF